MSAGQRTCVRRAASAAVGLDAVLLVDFGPRLPAVEFAAPALLLMAFGVLAAVAFGVVEHRRVRRSRR